MDFQAIKKEYNASADAIRCASGKETAEMRARYERASAAHEAALADLLQGPPKPAWMVTGWWNLPVAASMWKRDACDLDA